MEKIFENAKFRDTYIDSNNDVLVYLNHNVVLTDWNGENPKHCHTLVDCNGKETHYDDYGILLDEFGDTKNGIGVTRYTEPIDDDALRENAYEWTSFVLDDDLRIKVIAMECAMIGYRKAKEV